MKSLTHHQETKSRHSTNRFCEEKWQKGVSFRDNIKKYALLPVGGEEFQMLLNRYEFPKKVEICEKNGFNKKPICYQGTYNIVTRGMETKLLPILRANGISFNAFGYVAQSDESEGFVWHVTHNIFSRSPSRCGFLDWKS